MRDTGIPTDVACGVVYLCSGVTMGWLLRLVTGAPLVVGAPDSSILF